MTCKESIVAALSEMELIWELIGDSEPALIRFSGKTYRILQDDREAAEKLIELLKEK